MRKDSGGPSQRPTKLISVSRTETRQRRRLSSRLITTTGLLAPFVLHEMFQTGEHHAPIPFSFFSRLLGRTVVLRQRHVRLRSIVEQLHSDDVVVLRQIGVSSRGTEMAVLEHALSDEFKNDPPVLVRPALPLPFHTIGLPTTHSEVTVAPDMYSLIAAGDTSASHTSAAGAVIVTDVLAISAVFIGAPEPRSMASFA